MSEIAFQGAGKTPGLELWRIEKLRPVKQPKADGKFHVGDSYILLSTTKSKSGSISWAIHFWLGAETSQDEAGVAAYKTVELDESLGGGPVQYREVQGSESSLFLSYFKSSGGIEYLPGGVDSGFNKVERDVYVTRLLHLKGKRTVRVTEVPCNGSSLNKGDVFILDAGLKIYLFNGQEANKYEKAKGIEVASQINSDQRGGRAEIIIVNEDIRNEGFWGPLGGYRDPASLPVGESDDIVESVKKVTKLFHISDASGSLQFNEVALEDGKLKRSDLNGDDVFLVVTSAKIYIWVGKKSTPAEKKEAMPRAVEFIRQNGLPSNTVIERVSEGNETSAFKAEFSVWSLPVSFGHVAKSGVKKEDVPIEISQLLARKEVEDSPVDDGSGKLQIWVIQDFKKVELPLNKYGQFHGGDSYILLYTYLKNRVENYVIYYWLGRDSTADEKGTAALLAKELDDSFGGRPVQVRVTQGKEPAHFRQLFKGSMIVHAGGHASGFKNKNDSDSFDADGVALFHVRGTNALNTFGVQVAELASSLNSEDTFVLVNPSHVYVWLGQASNADEKKVALNIASILAPDFNGTGGREIVTVTEGHEPNEFWSTLGGKTEYPSLAPGENTPRDPRLFHASTATGSFRVEEVENYDQTDLNDEDVFLLDTYTSLFVWIGNGSTQEEKDKSLELAQRYVAEANDGRDSDIPIIRVHAGEEPVIFTRHFHVWDNDFAKKNTFIDPYKAKLDALAAAKAKALAGEASSSSVSSASAAAPVKPAATATATAVKGQYSYDELRSGIPAGVDPTRKEDYLSDDELKSVFGMDRAALAALPKWKRDQKKKDVGLF